PEVDELAEVTDSSDPGTASEANGSRNALGDLRVVLRQALDDPEQGRRVGPSAAITAAIGTLRKKGFARLMIDGRAVTLEDVDIAALKDRSLLKIIVDRVALNGEDLRQRLTDSIETAYLEGGGAAWAIPLPSGPARPEPPAPILFSERFECRQCGITFGDPQPRLLSFNNPFGACPPGL